MERAPSLGSAGRRTTGNAAKKRAQRSRKAAQQWLQPCRSAARRSASALTCYRAGGARRCTAWRATALRRASRRSAVPRLSRRSPLSTSHVVPLEYRPACIVARWESSVGRGASYARARAQRPRRTRPNGASGPARPSVAGGGRVVQPLALSTPRVPREYPPALSRRGRVVQPLALARDRRGDVDRGARQEQPLHRLDVPGGWGWPRRAELS